jgi:DNA-directed RNA polymerase specialized sigma24 family protein
VTGSSPGSGPPTPPTSRAWPNGPNPNYALRARARLSPGRNSEEHAERVDSRVGAEGLRGELAGAIAALPRGQRDVLLLVALADLSYDEVAAALGISSGTVGSRLNRARTTLRKALGGTNPMLTWEEQHG